MPPNGGGARNPPARGANAVAGTRPSNPRSIRILVSALRSNGCPTCALSQVGLTPSSGVGSLQWGLGQVQENCGVLQLDADRYQAAVSRSQVGCPHPWGSATARGATIGGRPVHRAPKPAFALARGIARAKQIADRRIAVGNVAPVAGVVPPLLGRTRGLKSSLDHGPDRTAPAVYGRCRCAARPKFRYDQSPERRDDGTADPTAAANCRARENGNERRVIRIRPRAVGEGGIAKRHVGPHSDSRLRS